MRQQAEWSTGRGDPMLRGSPYDDSAKRWCRRSRSARPALENLRYAAERERSAAREREAREQTAAREREAREAAIASPLTQRSAAVLLLGLCDDIDRTCIEPTALDAGEHRTELRAYVVRIGQRLYDQGGEPLMLEVAVLVRSASSHGSLVSRERTIIGSWMG